MAPKLEERGGEEEEEEEVKRVDADVTCKPTATVLINYGGQQSVTSSGASINHMTLNM